MLDVRIFIDVEWEYGTDLDGKLIILFRCRFFRWEIGRLILRLCCTNRTQSSLSLLNTTCDHWTIDLKSVHWQRTHDRVLTEQVEESQERANEASNRWLLKLAPHCECFETHGLIKKMTTMEYCLRVEERDRTPLFLLLTVMAKIWFWWGEFWSVVLTTDIIMSVANLSPSNLQIRGHSCQRDIAAKPQPPFAYFLSRIHSDSTSRPFLRSTC